MKFENTIFNGLYLMLNTSGTGDPNSWSTTLNRRYDLLRTFIILLAAVCFAFSIINYFRGLYYLAVAELFIFFISLWMLFYIRKRERLRLISFIFICVSCSLGLFGSAISATHPTFAVWNSLSPFFAFYLLGKKKGAVITVIYIPISTVLYMVSHSTGVNAIPLVAVMNIVLFMLCISWIAYHFETTRSETERALLDDIDERIKTEHELEKTVEELKQASSEVKTLSGLLPICSSCKKIRDDRGYWTQIESYVKRHSNAEFSHGICPDCAKKYYPDLMDDNE